MRAFDLSPVNLGPSVRLKRPLQVLGPQAIANEGSLNLRSLDWKHYQTSKRHLFPCMVTDLWREINRVFGFREVERAQCTDQLGAQFIGPDGHNVVGGGYSRRSNVGWGLRYGRGGF